METNEFLFKLLLLFFPGIICAHIVDSLTVHRPRESMLFLLQSFIFGIVSYFAYWGILIVLHYFWPSIGLSVTFLNSLSNATVAYSFREIALVTIVAIFIGCAVSKISRHKILHRLARTLRLTKKFGDLDVWGYLMNQKDVNWVTVRDHPNNLAYDGWIAAFSDDSKDAELLLREVSVYTNDTGERLYQVGEVYLSKAREDISIERRAIPVTEGLKWKESNNEQERGSDASADTTATDTTTATGR